MKQIPHYRRHTQIKNDWRYTPLIRPSWPAEGQSLLLLYKQRTLDSAVMMMMMMMMMMMTMTINFKLCEIYGINFYCCTVHIDIRRIQSPTNNFLF